MRRGLVIGRAQGVWEEVAAAQALCEFDDIIITNRTALDWPHRLDHWVSFHADLMMGKWAEERRHRGYPDALNYWTSIYRGKPLKSHIDGLQRVRCDGGSSGLVAIIVALEGAKDDVVVLAGVPMEPGAEHYDEAGAWTEALKYRGAWGENLSRIQGKVRSMSGWTRELLGYPTHEWLHGNEGEADRTAAS